MLFSFSVLSIFIWIYSGFNYSLINFDNSNYVFTLLLVILFPIINWIIEFETKVNQYINIVFIVINELIIIFIIILLFYVFINYEFIIVLLFIVLIIFIPSYYRIRTSLFFFIFSIIGSFIFIISIIYCLFYSLFSFILIIMFIIKLPSFPFYYWLPEVHCEGNTSLSIILAGLILKLSLFGIIRFIIIYYLLCIRTSFIINLFVILIGLLIIICSYFRYYDLKKTIALSSILHLNLVLYSLLPLISLSIISVLLACISHSLSSVLMFNLIGFIIILTYIRLIDNLFLLTSILRLLLFISLLFNNSFISSINYVSELFILVSVINISLLCIIIILFISFLSTLFYFILFNRKTPYYYSYYIISIIYSFILFYYILFSCLIGGYFLFLGTNVSFNWM